MKNLSYSERLSKLKLYSLERWRLGGDLIEVYTILTGKEGVNCQQFFKANMRLLWFERPESESTVENTSLVRDQLVNGVGSRLSMLHLSMRSRTGGALYLPFGPMSTFKALLLS